MNKIPNANSTGNLSVSVELKNAADVFLVDSTNFRKWQNGQRFKFYGGHYTKNPVNIRVSGYGRWYLIVDGSAYKYKFY